MDEANEKRDKPQLQRISSSNFEENYNNNNIRVSLDFCRWNASAVDESLGSGYIIPQLKTALGFLRVASL